MVSPDQNDTTPIRYGHEWTCQESLGIFNISEYLLPSHLFPRRDGWQDSTETKLPLVRGFRKDGLNQIFRLTARAQKVVAVTTLGNHYLKNVKVHES